MKQLIKTLGLKQKDFAGKLNMHQGSISNIINGKYPVTTKLIDLIHYVYQVDKNWWNEEGPVIFSNPKIINPDIVLSESELELLNFYRNINKAKQNQLLNFAKFLQKN